MASYYFERALFFVGESHSGKSNQLRSMFRDVRLGTGGDIPTGTRLDEVYRLSNERSLYLRLTSPHEVLCLWAARSASFAPRKLSEALLLYFHNVATSFFYNSHRLFWLQTAWGACRVFVTLQFPKRDEAREPPRWALEKDL